MGIRLSQTEDASLIHLEGAVDIGSAAGLKATLLDALKSGKPVRVALDGCTDLDVTAVQLLWAAEREARASAVGFALAGAVPEPVWAALKDAGFTRFPVPA